MSQWALADIAACLGVPLNRLSAETMVSEISTDSRTLKRGSLFVPLVGEKFDGHDYAKMAVEEKGATVVLWSRSELPAWLSEREDVEVLKVEDTLDSYQALGLYWRKKCGVRCIGVTGSVGKTTTKEFLAHFLAPHFALHKSKANFNNDIGVPKTLLEVKPEHDLVIVEMGMRGSGEIARLVRAAEPELGIITAIGTSHIELLGSREAIARAKGELVEGLPAGGFAVLPASDDYFELLCELSSASVLSFSAVPDLGDLSPQVILSQDSEGTRFTYRGTECRLPLPGTHHLHDLFAVLAAGQVLGIEPSRMLEDLASLTNPDGRAEWVAVGQARFYMDAYNSAPESLRASLGVLKACPSRRIAVLADMLELGEAGPEAHRDIGTEMAANGVELALCYGELCQGMVQAAQAAGVDARWFESKDEMAEILFQELRAGDSVLVKASRGMALETVVKAVREKIGQNVASTR